MKSLILMFISLAGCGSYSEFTYTPPDTSQVPLPVIDREFRPYLETFLREAHARQYPLTAKKLSIVGLEALSEADKYPNAAGICYPTEVRVEVKMPYWRTLDNTMRERLIFHELGHCLLGRTHREIQVMTPDGPYYGSLMEPSLFTGHPELRAYYLDELFGKL